MDENWWAERRAEQRTDRIVSAITEAEANARSREYQKALVESERFEFGLRWDTWTIEQKRNWIEEIDRRRRIEQLESKRYLAKQQASIQKGLEIRRKFQIIETEYKEIGFFALLKPRVESLGVPILRRPRWLVGLVWASQLAAVLLLQERFENAEMVLRSPIDDLLSMLGNGNQGQLLLVLLFSMSVTHRLITDFMAIAFSRIRRLIFAKRFTSVRSSLRRVVGEYKSSRMSLWKNISLAFGSLAIMTIWNVM